jgi:uncharacterized repeat protein (TIGR01451 family)
VARERRAAVLLGTGAPQAAVALEEAATMTSSLKSRQLRRAAEVVRRPPGAHYAPRPPASRPVQALVALLVALLSVGGLTGLAVEPAAAAIGVYDASDRTIDTHPSISASSDLVKSNADNSYTQGAKEDDVCPTVSTGSIPPSKDDFVRFYEGFSGNVLYLAFERSNDNGTATIDFELNQSSTGCGNGVNKVRTAGDLLITYDFQGGDTAAVPIQIRTWTGSAWSAPTLLTAGTAEASISADLLKGELAIDLVKAGIFQTGTCVSFASGFAKSRASSAFTSELKDLVGPIEKTVSNCASITIVKDANVTSSSAFDFTFDPPGSGANTTFALYDDGSTASPDSTPDRRTFASLTDTAGSYVVTEVEPDVTPGAWDLTDIVCSGGTTTKDLANNRVTIVPGGPVNVTCTFKNTFDPPPTVNVLKTARTPSIDEPGAVVTFDVAVTNTSNEPVTLTTLTDQVGAGPVVDVFGLGSDTTCVDNTPIAAGATYNCWFRMQVSGNAGATRTDVVTAVVVDAEGDTGTDTDDAVVTINDVLPSIALTKTANTSFVLEPGGNVTYTLVVTNLSNEQVTITDLTDTVAGNTTDVFTLTTTCVDNTILAAADNVQGGGDDTYTCTFTRAVNGNAGTVHTNTAEATAVDDDGSTAKASDVENVSITNVAPTVSVLKTARTSTIAEPGGTVTFDVVVTNLSNEAVKLTTLTDDKGGNLFTRPGSTCVSGSDLAANDNAAGGPDTYSCSFTLPVTGNAGTVHDNRVDATVTDNDGSTASAFDTERVTITNVAPTVLVTKTASPTEVAEPGGTVTYTVVVRNTSNEAVTLTDLTDTASGATTNVFTITGTTCLDDRPLAAGDGVAGGPDTYTCTFTGTVSGNADDTHVDVVEATVVDDDGSTAKNNDDAVVTLTDALPGIQVVKTASPTTVRVGDLVTYTYAVTTTTSESLSDVEVEDDKCSPVTFVGGDTDGDTLLDPGETWTFRCTSTLTVDTTNVGTATGNDDEGNPATDTDDAVVDVVNPAIAVDKTADRQTAEPGQVITYTYVVTNPGDDPLKPVTLADDKCAPVTFVSGDADGDGALDPGESWRYTCVATAGAAGSLVNVATVTGTPTVGPDVTAKDTVTVAVEAPAVLPAAVPEAPQPVVVPPAPAIAPTIQAAPATLPRTGGEPGAPVRAALVLLVLGGLALIPEHLRRRRTGVVAITTD